MIVSESSSLKKTSAICFQSFCSGGEIFGFKCRRPLVSVLAVIALRLVEVWCGATRSTSFYGFLMLLVGCHEVTVWILWLEVVTRLMDRLSCLFRAFKAKLFLKILYKGGSILAWRDGVR